MPWLVSVSHCKELSDIHPNLCFLSLELKFEHERFLFIKCEKSSGWSFSEWEFLCSWCGFKDDILFLRNLEEEVLQKLYSGHIKNVSSHVTSEISHSSSSVRLMLWCVYVFKLLCRSFPSWGVETRMDSPVWEPRGEILWLGRYFKLVWWMSLCPVCALCLCLSAPVMVVLSYFYNPLASWNQIWGYRAQKYQAFGNFLKIGKLNRRRSHLPLMLPVRERLYHPHLHQEPQVEVVISRRSSH